MDRSERGTIMDRATKAVAKQHALERLAAMNDVQRAANAAIERIGTNWGTRAEILYFGGTFRWKRIAVKRLYEDGSHVVWLGIDGLVYEEYLTRFGRFIKEVRHRLTQDNINPALKDTIISALNRLN